MRLSSLTSSAQEKKPATLPSRSRCGRRVTEIHARRAVGPPREALVVHALARERALELRAEVARSPPGRRARAASCRRSVRGRLAEPVGEAARVAKRMRSSAIDERDETARRRARTRPGTPRGESKASGTATWACGLSWAVTKCPDYAPKQGVTRGWTLDSEGNKPLAAGGRAPRQWASPGSGSAPGRRARRAGTGARRDPSTRPSPRVGPVRDDHAVAEEVEVVGEAHRLVHVVGHDHRGRAERVVQRADEVAHDVERDRVEARERLVVDDERRDRARSRARAPRAAPCRRRAPRA